MWHPPVYCTVEESSCTASYLELLSSWQGASTLECSHTGTRHCQTANFTEQRRVHAKMFSNQCLVASAFGFELCWKFMWFCVFGLSLSNEVSFEVRSSGARAPRCQWGRLWGVSSNTGENILCGSSCPSPCAQPCFSRQHQQVPSARPAAGSGASAPPCPFPAAEVPPPSPC